jgi:hypothetical protein
MEHLKNESSGFGTHTHTHSLSLHVNGKHRVARERENIACYMEENEMAREREAASERERQQARERGSKRERETAGECHWTSMSTCQEQASSLALSQSL